MEGADIKGSSLDPATFERPVRYLVELSEADINARPPLAHTVPCAEKGRAILSFRQRWPPARAHGWVSRAQLDLSPVGPLGHPPTLVQ